MKLRLEGKSGEGASGERKTGYEIEICCEGLATGTFTAYFCHGKYCFVWRQAVRFYSRRQEEGRGGSAGVCYKTWI